MRGIALALTLALAGCAAPAVLPDPSETVAGPIFDASGCTAHNAFLQTTQGALQPHVPSNWTFTGAREPHAILRMLHVACDDGRGLLVLSTPMAPDEASRDKHENPDVVIDVFTSDAAALAAWNATGARAALGDFTLAPFPGGESRIVTSEGALALGLDVLPEPPRPRGSYEWRAVYAAGVDPIGWFWGDEIAEASAFMAYSVHLGPATRVDGADAHPFGSGSFWPRIDLRYDLGLPPAEE